MMEMAFVYGVVTLALDTLDTEDPHPSDKCGLDRVSSLLGQAGFDVFTVDGGKNGVPHEWLEVGHIGQTSELIVDLSVPERPHDTVLHKSSRRGMLYSVACEGTCVST
jgi:hypothetical protein